MDVRLPDGTVIRNVPEGTTKAQLTEKLARNGYDMAKLSGGKGSGKGGTVHNPFAEDASPGDQVPGGGLAGNRNVGKKDKEHRSTFEKVGGVVEPILAIGTGITGGTLGAIGGTAKGLVKSVRNGTFGTATGADQVEKSAAEGASALTYQPRTTSGAQNTAAIAQKVADSGIAGVPLAELATLGRASAPAAELAGNAVRGAAKPAGAKLAQLGGAVVPKIDSETARLAQKAHDYGIPLRPDMLYKNKLAKMAGEAAEKVPLSGSQAGERQTAFNRAIIKVIGGDQKAEKLTPDVFDQAIRSAGQKIGDIAAKTPLKIDKNLSEALDSHLANVAKYETSDVARAVTSYIEDLREKAQEGIVPGEAFRKLNTKINSQLRTTSNGDLKHALGQLQDDLHEALERGLSGHDLATLKAARTQYAAAKTIEPLVAKSAAGDISPAGLMGRVTSNNAGKSRMARGRGGELGDLARIGQRFLKEPQSSGTAERGLVYGLAGGGVVAEPHTAAAVYGAANAYNRTGAALARKLTPKLSDLAGKGGN